MCLNCNSVRSIARRARFLALVHENLPDIIVGCKSQLDQSYSSTEVFPDGYYVLRKDRCDGAGGVFVCVKDTLSMSAVPSLDTCAELLWAKIIRIQFLSVHFTDLQIICLSLYFSCKNLLKG